MSKRFLAGTADIHVRTRAKRSELFDLGKLHLSTAAIHTVKPLEVDIPKGRLTVVTGVSGSGKTTLILESLVPGLMASISGKKLPEHVLDVETAGIRQVKLIAATPMGINVPPWFWGNVVNILVPAFGTKCPEVWAIFEKEETMDKNAGYEIKQAVLFDNGRGMALGESATAPALFVTWQFTDEAGKRDYYWGHYACNQTFQLSFSTE